MKLHYFANGSNMCTGRLCRRVPSAHPLFVAQLHGHVLRFHKRSTDGSGKTDAEYTGNHADFVWGVVFEIDSDQKPDLDRAEGLGRGFEEKQIGLQDSTGQTSRAWMYFASESHKSAALRPYSWYLRFVVEGAKQHGLPPDYIAFWNEWNQSRIRTVLEMPVRKPSHVVDLWTFGGTVRESKEGKNRFRRVAWMFRPR